jgi:hypothetical protein
MTVPPGRALSDHANGQAVQDAKAVVEPLDLVAGRVELVGDALVHDHHRAALDQQVTAGGQDANRIATDPRVMDTPPGR